MMGGWRQFFVAAILVAVFQAASSAEEAPAGIDPSLVIEQFEIFNDGDFLLVPVKVFGKSRLFVVDTGCTWMVYDERLRPQLGEALRTAKASTTTGKLSVDLFDAPPATLGNLDLRTESPVASFDFSELRQQTGHEIEGIIGMSFLRQHIVHLDFEARRLLLLSDVPGNAGKRTYLVYEKDVPMVRGQIKDAYGHFFEIDTGFRGGARLSSDLFEFLVGRETIADVTEAKIFGAAGRAAVRDGYLAWLSLDECRLTHVPTHANLPHDRDNSLGMDILTRFTTTFDFPNMVAYLKPNRNAKRPFEDYIGGMGFVRKSGDTIVESVRSDGPASKAGIQEGDCLLEIDGFDATTARLHTLHRQLSVPGATVHVKLKRGDEIIQIDLELPQKEEAKTALQDMDSHKAAQTTEGMQR